MLVHFQNPQIIYGRGGFSWLCRVFWEAVVFRGMACRLETFNITILEFFPIVLASEIWGPLMRNKCIVFFSDNQAAVEIINKQTSKDRSIMVLLRHFVLSTLKYNILFHAKHIAGCINRESDALFRLQVRLQVPGGLLPNNLHITWPSFCTQPLRRDHVGLTNERGRHMSSFPLNFAILDARCFQSPSTI